MFPPNYVAVFKLQIGIKLLQLLLATIMDRKKEEGSKLDVPPERLCACVCMCV